jgi:hypothetical protein
MAYMGPPWGQRKIYRQSKRKSMVALHKLLLIKHTIGSITRDSSMAGFIPLRSWQDSGRDRVSGLQHFGKIGNVRPPF